MTKKLKIETLQDAKQACFNGSVRGLSWQKWEQSMIGASCCLNGYEGRHCAIGWLVPPEKYDSCVVGSQGALEKGILPDPIMDWYRSTPLIEGRVAFRRFLLSLMSAHDTHSTPEHMHDAFRDLGKQHGLSWPEEA